MSTPVEVEHHTQRHLIGSCRVFSELYKNFYFGFKKPLDKFGNGGTM
jgi:hypothetical protein